MTLFPPTNIQGSPFAVPIKWYRLIALIKIVEFLKIIVFDYSCPFLIKQSKRDFVLGIRL